MRLDPSVRTRRDSIEPFRPPQIAFQVTRNGSKSAWTHRPSGKCRFRYHPGAEPAKFKPLRTVCFKIIVNPRLARLPCAGNDGGTVAGIPLVWSESDSPAGCESRVRLRDPATVSPAVNRYGVSHRFAY
jgi:hypothetical protein